MLKIGITQRVDEIAGYGELREALDVKWAKLLSSLNMQAIPLTSFGNNTNVFEELDGFILTGGNDPSQIKGSSGVCVERDIFEAAIISYASSATIPILGVCRGMLMLALHYECPISPCIGHVAVLHEVNFKERLFGFDDTPAMKNSFHKFATYESRFNSNDLSIVATTSDGVVESFRHKKLPQLGVMWHPERYDDFSEPDKNLLKAFFHEN